MKTKEYVLLQDIVIPKGTIFRQAPALIRLDDSNFECTIGLSNNSYGTFVYSIDPEDELSDFFTEVK